MPFSMLESLGPFYYVVVLLEVAMWEACFSWAGSNSAGPVAPSLRRPRQLRDARGRMFDFGQKTMISHRHLPMS